MRIGLLTSLAHGGPVEHALVLGRELVARGHDVRALCATDRLGARFAAIGAEPAVIALRPGLDVSGALAARRALRDADVLHAHDRRSALWMRLLPRPSAEVALVQTVHGLPDAYLPPPAGPGRPGMRAVAAYRGVDAKLAWRCGAVLTPSAAMARLLVDRLGYPRRRLFVVPNGVAMPPRPGATGAAVGTLSGLDAVKGLDTFLAAAALLAGSYPDVPFVVHGVGPEEARLRACADELGLAGRAAFPGHVPAEAALTGLRILVVSSLMENAPMSVLEAMAHGVPVVATAVGGIPELAPAGTAALVPARDPAALAGAIARLLDDPARAEAQAARARAHAHAHFGSTTMAERVETLYRAAVARRT